MGGNAGAACQKRGNHKQLRNGLHRTLPIYMINVFYKELSGVATGNRSRPLRGMRRSIRKIAVAENASIAARKIIGARSLPVASWIFGTTACATKPPRLPTELIAANTASAAAQVRKRPRSTTKTGGPGQNAPA